MTKRIASLVLIVSLLLAARPGSASASEPVAPTPQLVPTRLAIVRVDHTKKSRRLRIAGTFFVALGALVSIPLCLVAASTIGQDGDMPGLGLALFGGTGLSIGAVGMAIGLPMMIEGYQEREADQKFMSPPTLIGARF